MLDNLIDELADHNKNDQHGQECRGSARGLLTDTSSGSETQAYTSRMHRPRGYAEAIVGVSLGAPARLDGQRLCSRRSGRRSCLAREDQAIRREKELGKQQVASVTAE